MASLEELRLIEEQCRMLADKGHEDAEKLLREVLLKIELQRPRMGGYAGKIDLLEVARFRNNTLTENEKWV